MQHDERVPNLSGPSDNDKDRWLGAALAEYGSLREESLKGLQAQQVGVQIGVTLLAALIGTGSQIGDRLTGALLLTLGVPLLVIFITILWTGELERSVRVGRYLKVREQVISDVTRLPRTAPSMGWEAWLSRNPELRLVRYYNAEFTVVGLLALASSIVGVLGLLSQRRWESAGVLGLGALFLLFTSVRLYRLSYKRLMSIGTTHS